MPLGDILLGPKVADEINQKVKSITAALVPLLTALNREQEKTNELLSEILKELRYQHRQKK